MISMTSTFTQLSKADKLKIYTKIVVNTSTTITNDDFANLSVEEQTANNNIELGTSYSSMLKFDYYGNVDLVGKWLQPYISFDNIEWCPLGKFKTVTIEDNDCGYYVTAYDQIAFLTDEYTITTPKTFSQMISDFGLELEVGQTVPSVTISEGFLGTERDYLGWIAGYMGRNARINRNGNLVFVWYETHSTLFGDANNDGVINSSDTTYITNNLLGKYTNPAASGVLGLMKVGTGHIGGEYTNIGQADVNEDGIVNSADVSEINAYINGTPYPGTKVGTNYQSQEYDEDELILNGFKATTKGTQKISALISGYGENVYEVGSGRYISFTNPFMTQAQLQSIWNEIITNSGFNWQPCEIELFGNPAYEVGDIATVKIGNVRYSVPLMSQKIEVSTSLKTTLKSYGWSDEKAIVNVDSNGKIEREISQLQAETERITSELNNTQGMYGGTYEKIYQTIGGNSRPIGFKIIDNTDSDKYWRFDYNGLRFTSNDGASYKVGISNTGSILADNLVSGAILTNHVTAQNLTITGGSINVNTSSEETNVIQLNYDENCSSAMRPLGFVSTYGEYESSLTGGGLEVKSDDSTTTITPSEISTPQVVGETIKGDNVYVRSGLNLYEVATQNWVLGNNYYGYLDSPTFSNITATNVYARIGDSNNQNYVYIDAGEASVDTVYRSTTSGILGTSGSLRKWKHDISDLTDEVYDVHGLYDLPVRQYKWNEGHFGDNYDYSQWSMGFIAEEVEEHFPRGTIYRNGELASWGERNFIPALVKLVQEQHTEIESLKERIEVLENERTTETT